MRLGPTELECQGASHAGQGAGGFGGRSDRSPCVVTLSPASLPFGSHPSERRVTGRREQEEPSSVQVLAAAEEAAGGGGGGAAGGDFRWTRRRGFVFATMKTRTGHQHTPHGSVRPIN